MTIGPALTRKKVRRRSEDVEQGESGTDESPDSLPDHRGVRRPQRHKARHLGTGTGMSVSLLMAKAKEAELTYRRGSVVPIRPIAVGDRSDPDQRLDAGKDQPRAPDTRP